MLAAYGIDTLDPGVTPRRVWVLASRLPPAAQSPGEPWSAEAHLLALLVDHVANLTWVQLRAAGVKSAQRPKPVPRPARAARERSAAATAPRAAGSGHRAGSWLDAAGQLAKIPGVITRQGDG